MPKNRSSDSTKNPAAAPVEKHAIECGELAGVYARGLVARGYEAAADGGKVVTTAPQSVFADMDAAFKSRNQNRLTVPVAKSK